jgi:mannose-1-phosphate guanylyltransferase
VILAGGVGSRFWPLSTPDQPKQLLPLVTDKPLLVEALDRLRPMVESAHILVLTNDALTKAIRSLAKDLPDENIIAEPRPAGTAAALAWAAHSIVERDGPAATMICVHADWAIGDDEKFRAALLRAEQVAVENRTLVTVGIVPDRTETGFGYIQPADVKSSSPSRVKRFVEKPDRASAEAMRANGYLWNSGIFVWLAGDFLDEVRAHTPELRRALMEVSTSNASRFFESVDTPISVDVGVLERSAKVMVIPGDFGWDDIGTWGALRRVRRKDEDDNVVSGNAHLLESSGNVVHVDSGELVMYGVKDLVVVTKGKLTLVTTTERASDLKRLIASLSAAEPGKS